MCQKVSTLKTVFVPSVFVEGKTKTRRFTRAAFANERRHLQRTIVPIFKESIAHALPAVQSAAGLKKQKKNRRPLWQGKLENLCGDALRRWAEDEFEMDELTISESHTDLQERLDDDVVIDSDLDQRERFGMDEGNEFEDEDHYPENDDNAYFEDEDYYPENDYYACFEDDNFEDFLYALDSAPVRFRASPRDLPCELRRYMAGYINDPSLDAQMELDFEQNWDGFWAELVGGTESEEFEVAYQRPRISKFFELPGGRLKRRKGSHNGSPSLKNPGGSNKRLRRFCGGLEEQNRRKQSVSIALYKAYEEEVHSIEAETQEQERIAAREACRLRLRAERKNDITTGGVVAKAVLLKSRSSELGFRSPEELNLHLRAVLLGQRG